MSELRLFVPIGKVDAAKRIVYGTSRIAPYLVWYGEF
jgi:hypothetical protein